MPVTWMARALNKTLAVWTCPPERPPASPGLNRSIVETACQGLAAGRPSTEAVAGRHGHSRRPTVTSMSSGTAVVFTVSFR